MRRALVWPMVALLAACSGDGINESPGGGSLGKADSDRREAAAPMAIWASVVETWNGEMDPYAIGDVCVILLREGTEGPYRVLLEDFDSCTNTHRLESDWGKRVWVRVADAQPVTEEDQLAVLREWLGNDDSAAETTFHWLTGDLLDIAGLAACEDVGEQVTGGCIDSSKWEECVPRDGDDGFGAAMSCCAYGLPYCEGFTAPSDGSVTAARLRPPAGVGSAHGFLGYMHVDVDGERFVDPALSRVLTIGQAVFGDDCDGVPTGAIVAFDEQESVDAFFEFLREETVGWSSTLESAELDGLESFLSTEGREHFRIFSGGASGEACGGDGEVSFHLIWNTQSDDVLYLILYPYSE